MMPFNVNKINDKWIIGTNSTYNVRNGLTNWSSLGPILVIPSVIDNHIIDEIGTFAFYNCQEIEEVFIGNGIKQINERGFSYCLNLRSIIIPPTIEIIGKFGIHCCNMSSEGLYGTYNEKNTGRGTLIVTFLHESRISYVGFYGISRKENIIIYFLGKTHPFGDPDPFAKSMVSSVNVYAPFVSRFLKTRTLRYSATQCNQKKLNKLSILYIIIYLE